MEEQTRFFGNLREVMTALSFAADNLATLQRIAMARGYDQWQDADLEGTGYTRNDLLALLYLADDLKAFLENGTPAQGNRRPTLDKFRGDL